MLNLVDRAFGGLGTVSAPTHEQAYGIDSTLRDRAIAAETARIRAEVEAANPEPDAIDPALTGTERRRAQQARARATSARRRTITAEMRRRRAEITRARRAGDDLRGVLRANVPSAPAPTFSPKRSCARRSTRSTRT